MQQRVSRVSYKWEHTRGQWSTKQDSVLEIKSGLRETQVSAQGFIYRGRSESEAGYER